MVSDYSISKKWRQLMWPPCQTTSTKQMLVIITDLHRSKFNFHPCLERRMMHSRWYCSNWRVRPLNVQFSYKCVHIKKKRQKAKYIKIICPFDYLSTLLPLHAFYQHQSGFLLHQIFESRSCNEIVKWNWPWLCFLPASTCLLEAASRWMETW